VSRTPEVIVIGAGVVGCAIAFELARRKVPVQVVDERPVGMGATQASAGILAPYVEAHEGSPLYDLTVRSLNLFDQFIDCVSSESGHRILYRRTGTLDVAADEADMQALAATAERLSRREVAAKVVDGPTARLEEPQLTADVLGGLLIPAHGFVSANGLTSALAIAARRHGAVFEARRVVRIKQAGDAAVVETDGGPLRGHAVVLAAGSWSGTVEIQGVASRLPVRPVRGQLLCLTWQGPAPRRVTLSRKCYLVPWDDGTVLVGATVEEAGFDERATVAGVRDLLEAAAELAPHAWTAGFGGVRVGLRPGTTDDLPVIGPSGVMPNLMYATGHYRNGVLLAPLTAKLVADAMLDNRLDEALPALSPTRFGDL
jgi:glycine oxidase